MTTTTASVLDTARTYWEAGLTPMPRVTGHVEPSYVAETGTIDAIRWGEYKSKQPDWATVARWFVHSDLATVGLLLLTGNHAHPRAEDAAFLQILDIETPDLVAALQEALHFLGHSAILHRCVIERTPSGGGHVGFLCRSITDKHKLPLARRVDHKLLIELLQHQPCTVAPTMIRCKPAHPAGVGYTLLHGRWDQPQEISAAQRQVLLDVARSFNEVPEKVAHDPHGRATDGTRPGDLLNGTADIDWWHALLTRYAWRDVSRPGWASRGLYYFQRPGKRGRTPSATYGKTGACLYVFSSNAHPFAPDTAYTAFSAYTLLEHQGDFSAAAAALATAYGVATTAPAGPPRSTLPTLTTRLPQGVSLRLRRTL